MRNKLHQAARGMHSSIMASHGRVRGVPYRRKKTKRLRLHALILGICLRAQSEWDGRVIRVIYLQDDIHSIKDSFALAADADIFKKYHYLLPECEDAK